MATPDEITTIADTVDVSPDGGKRQEYELTNPTPGPSAPLATLSKDQVSNQSVEETILSFYAKWRFQQSISLSTSSTGNIYSEYVQLSTLFDMTDFSIPSVGSFIANGSEYIQRTYVGVKFDMEYKFTLYSSSQQQGALIFYYFPGFSISTANADPIISYTANQTSNKFFTNGDPLGGIPSTVLNNQLPHKIISFGAETELIMTVPYLTKYDFIPIQNWPIQDSWGAIRVDVFDPLVVRSGTYDTVTVRVERRATNISFIGPSFVESISSMGSYNGPPT